MKQTTRVWQIIGAVISIASLAWGIWSYVDKKTEAATSAATIIRQAQRIYDLQGQITAANKLVKTYQIEIDSLTKVSQDRLKASLQHKQTADRLRVEIEKLKSEQNEITLPVDDAGHIELFLDWTSPGREH
jgi:type II secretory pathway pseudopilin PulG